MLVKSALLAVALASGIANAQLEPFPCDNLRREWRTLTPGQQATYFSAINALQQSQQFPSWLVTHVNPGIDRYAHSSDGFFPWHRWYLWNFENQIRSMGGVYACVSIPYWDWSSDSAALGMNMAASTCYQAFGGPGTGQCIEQLRGSYTAPPFPSFASFRYPADAVGRFPSGCVRRVHRPMRIPMVQEILDILTRNTAYTADPRFRVGIRYALATAHNNIHNMVGGTMGATASCFDPIFMMHHCFIDKLWATWQSCHGVNNFPAAFADDAEPGRWSAQQAMPGFPTGVSPMMVADTTTIGGRGYSYAASALEMTAQWQSVMQNPGICGRLVTGRDAGVTQVNVSISQRELDALDTFAVTMRELSKTTNDTAMVSYLAARKTCESANNMGEYTEPTEWAQRTGTTAQELLSALNSPCTDVKVPNVDKALADARAFDKKVGDARVKAVADLEANATARALPLISDFYPFSRS